MFDHLQNILKLLMGQKKTQKGKQTLFITMLMFLYQILWNAAKTVINGKFIASGFYWNIGRL